MAEQTLKDKTSKGLFWGGLSNGAQQLLSLFFGIFLARLLSPEEYGMVGVLAIFSALALIVCDSGFVIALINKKVIRHEELNAVFWFSLFMAVLCYVILFFCAPLIARFFQNPNLISISRWSFLNFVITSLGIAPSVDLGKSLRIKEKAISNMVALVVSGTVGVILAFKGFSYWSIVIQTLIMVTIITSMYWSYSRWRPSFSWDFKPIKEMFGFSSKLLISNAFDAVNTYLFSIIFGRLYTEKEVGFFNQANKWNTMGASTIKGMVGSAAQPVLVEVGDEHERQLRIFRKMVRFTAFLSFPAMFGLALIAPEFIVITIKAKWLPSAELLRILCVSGAFVPIIHLFCNLVLSKGKSTAYMWAFISLSLVLFALMSVIYPLGITMMVIAYTVVNVCWVFIWFLLVRREIGYAFRQFLFDILPFLGITLALVFGAWFVTRGIDNIYLLLFSKVLLVAGSYSLVMWLSGSVAFKECIQFVFNRRRKNNE